MTACRPTLSGPRASIALDRLSGFAAALRERGLAVSTDEVITAVGALNALDLSDPESLYWGLRMAMVRSSGDLPVFESIFREYWHGFMTGGLEHEGPRHGRTAKGESASRSPGNGGGELEEREHKPASLGIPTQVEDAEDGATMVRAAYSAHEILRRKDFAGYDAADYERLNMLLKEARFEGPWRLSRRRRLHRSGLLDIRKTLRASFRTGGHPVRRIYRRPRHKHRQLTFVCDVSGSMERYSRAVLQLAYVVAMRRPRVDIFAFATRLSKLTGELPRKQPVAALAAAPPRVMDWSGGTRMGPCLAELNRSYGSAVRGAVVVIASDGWDLGDTEQLATETKFLHRLAHTLIWVNPHLQDPEFEPLTGGMSAALPAVDHFISCHNFASFASLFSLLETS